MTTAFRELLAHQAHLVQEERPELEELREVPEHRDLQVLPAPLVRHLFNISKVIHNSIFSQQTGLPGDPGTPGDAGAAGPSGVPGTPGVPGVPGGR